MWPRAGDPGEAPDRVPGADGRPVVRHGWLLAALLPVLLFWWLRLPLLADPGVERGWNSDHAVFGLMAQRVRETGRVAPYFWGQAFLGPLTPVLAAGLSLVRDAPRCEPFDLRLAAFLQHFLGLLAWGAGVRLLLGRTAALATMAFLAIGPAYLLGANPQPETLLLCGGLLFWYGARLLRLERRLRPGHLLAFGVGSGLSWWMHPGVVFVIGPALALLALGSGWYPPVRRALSPFGRLRFAPSALGWTPPRPLVIAAHVAQGWCVLRILAFLGAPFGFPAVPGPLWRPGLVEPLVLLAALHASLALPGVRLAAAWSAAGPALVWALPFAAGFVAGNAPPLLAAPPPASGGAYSYEAALLPDGGTLPRLLSLPGSSLLPFTSGSSAPAAHAFAWGLAGGAGLALLRRRARLADLLRLRPGFAGGAAFAGGVVLLSFAFYLFRRRAPAQIHYLVLAFPALVALAADGWSRALPRRKPSGLAVAALVAIGLLALHDGFAGARASILAEPDPHALTRSIRRAGFSVCYADYWVAYKHQFLSRESVRFIPYHSRDRNLMESGVLRTRPGRKCLVLPDGTFREILPGDEADQGGPARRRASAK